MTDSGYGDEAREDLEDDLYTRLNLSRDATSSEISNAFRRLSRIFHPDKHLGESQRAQASVIFQKLQQAHDILMDERKRAIYDMYGMRGLKIEGWEVMQRRPTAAEVREEYERLRRRKEEEKLFTLTQPFSRFTFGLDMSDIFDRYLQEPPSDRFERPRINVWKMRLYQSVEGHLSLRNSVRLAGSLGRTGKDSGMFQVVWRHLLNGGAYTEMEVGVSGSLRPHTSASLYWPIGTRVLLTAGVTAEILTDRNQGIAAITPGLNSSIVVRLAKQLQGRITTNWNLGSMTETELVWTTSKGHQVVVGSGLDPERCLVRARYVHNFSEYEASVNFGVKLMSQGLMVEYGASKRVSTYTTLGATLRVGVPVGVVVLLKISRGSQVYAFPVLLSDNVDPVALFYGTVVPLSLFYTIKRLVYDAWRAESRARANAERRQASAADRARRRREALQAQRLMREAVRRIRATESARAGLLIQRAIYGRPGEARMRGPGPDADPDDDAVVVDVTAPLQALVVNSSLVLTARETKASITGFYDPCPEEDKVLLVRYAFRDEAHEAVFEDSETVRIPQERHRVAMRREEEAES